MRLRDLENLTVGEDGLYNLFDYTFVGNETLTLYSFPLTERHEMRPDLVSEDLYGDNSYASVILDINNIKLPLSLKKGTVLIHTDLDTARKLSKAPDMVDNLRTQLINSKKRKRSDAARNDFKANENSREASKTTRPSIMANNKNTITLREGVIKIEPGF